MKAIPSTLSLLIATAFAPAVIAEPAGQALFTLGDVSVIDAAGKERPLKQGDAIEPGEKVVTKPGAIVQLKTPDGTRIGLRPESDLKLGDPKEVQARLELGRGTVRVLSDEKPGRDVKPILVQTPVSSMKIAKGDTESVFVPKDGGKAPDQQGGFHRLVNGKAELVLDQNKLLALKPLEVNSVNDAVKPPVVLTALPKGTVTFAPGESTITRSPTNPTPEVVGNLGSLARSVGGTQPDIPLPPPDLVPKVNPIPKAPPIFEQALQLNKASGAGSGDSRVGLGAISSGISSTSAKSISGATNLDGLNLTSSAKASGIGQLSIAQKAVQAQNLPTLNTINLTKLKFLK